MFANLNDKQLLEVMEQEKFLCFFNFKVYGADGGVALDGLCKIARSARPDLANYFSIVMIFDTTDETKANMAHRIPQKLRVDSFRKANPSVSAITSLPAAFLERPDHYAHNIDIIFPNGAGQNPSDVVNAIVYTLRHSAGLDTEQPVWWDDDAPAPTPEEKSGYLERIKAFLGIKP